MSCVSWLPNLGHESAVRSASPASHLDRDLGLGSLERASSCCCGWRRLSARGSTKTVLAGADTVQDLIVALGAANGTPAEVAGRAEPALRAPESSYTGLAEGIPSARTFQDVLRQRQRGRAQRARSNASRTQPDLLRRMKKQRHAHLRRATGGRRARCRGPRQARHRPRR